MRRSGLAVTAAFWASVILLALGAACQPLRQPLGSLGPRSGTAGSPGTVIVNQTPSLPPEWNDCDKTVFRCFQDPKVPSPPPPPDSFSGALDPDPAHKPALVYPLAASIHPLNLADITFQWRRALDAAQSLFRIRLARANGDVFEFFVPCDSAGGGPPVASECVYHLPPGAWLDLARTAHGEVLAVELAGVDPQHPATFSKSDPMTISFSPEVLTGGFYYWTGMTAPTVPDSPGTMRVLFGARAPTAFIVPNSGGNPQMCSGCHAVSRDGSTIAFTAGDAAEGSLHVASVATPNDLFFTPATTHDSGTVAVNRNGSRVLVSVAGKLFLRDATTGKQIKEVPPMYTGQPVHGFHPEWSPDDKSIALTLSAAGASDWSVATGSIGVLPYNDGDFGPVETLVPTGAEFNFYPTWSPDGHWIAFATAPVGPLETSYKQLNARLRLVNRDTKAVFELANATWKPGRTTTLPRFAPGTQAGGIMFLSFNSKIDYGVIRQNNAGGLPQLWLTMIDVRKLTTPDADPSSPPVWLPFQSVRPANYLGFWSNRVACRVVAGQAIGCGESEVCDDGACAMVAP